MRLSQKWSRIVRRTQPSASALLVASVVGTSACGDAEPPPPVPLEDRTPKVLLIGVDGIRGDILGQVQTPNLDALAAGGFFTGRTRTTTPSVSGPAWSSMLTGVWPEKHGVVDNEFEGRNYEAYPDFLTRIELANPELSTFAVADWLPLMEVEGGSPAIGETIDVRHELDGYEMGWAEADAEGVRLAVAELTTGEPDAMFVYLGSPDEVSHETGSIGREYRNAIGVADEQIGALVAAVRARPGFGSENWLVLVSTDHGRLSDGGHGGYSPIEMTTFILVWGPAAAIGGAGETTFIVDVPVTALSHLGIPIDPAWGLDGRPVGIR